VLRLLGLLVVISCSIQSVLALDPTHTISQYVRQKWQVENGFPQGPVYAISQTPDGYLWIGTEKGLARFDGIRFQLMQSAGTERPSLTQVLGLLTDREGSLWVRLLRPTLLRYRAGIFQNVMGSFGRPNASVSGMTRSPDGDLLLWVLEGEAKAIVLRDGAFKSLAAPAGFSRSPVLAVAQTQRGDVWIGTRDAGLFRLSGGRTTAINRGLPDLKVNSLVAAGNELWVGTDAGIVRWNGTELTKALPASLGRFQALAMILDRDSNLWVGTNSRGLLRITARGEASLEESGKKSPDAITALFEDREGNLWVGRGSGLEELSDSPFVTFSRPEGLAVEGSSPIYVNSADRIWFPAAGGGLWWMKGDQRGRVIPAGSGKDVIYSLAGDHDELWMGRQRGGLTRLSWKGNAVTTKTYTQADGLAQNSVYSVYEARDGSVWAGTLSGGVSRFSNGKFKTYTMADGLLSNTITSIVEGSDGTMWFGTLAGLSAFVKGKWRSYTMKDGLPSDNINCIWEDASGVVWAGTAAGLAFLDSGSFQAPPRAPRVLLDSIFGLAQDKYGFLWITTSKHVLRVRRENLLHGTLGEGDSWEYGLGDGLRSVEGVKRHRSMVTDRAGRVWLSTPRGVSVVDPGRLRGNTTPGLPQVQSLAADSAPLSLQGRIRVPAGSKRVSFGLAGLTLVAPERVRFRYRLDGFDHDWSAPVATREASYTNLAPGSYRFRLMASNAAGFWSGEEAAIAFEVDPLFWQTWWFRAGCALLCGLGALALYRLRLRQLSQQLNVRFEERLAERSRIAEELHDTLLEGFRSASTELHAVAKRLPPESQAKPILTDTLELADRVIEEGRSAVQGLRSASAASGDLESAFLEIREQLISQDRESECVDFRITIDGHQPPLHAVVWEETYRIGREALLNAFRHAHARKIDVELQYTSKQLRLVIRDDGRGIDAQVIDSGREGHWGLLGMRERADRLGARLYILSSAAAGTEIELSVPLAAPPLRSGF
jgi:ligand-binding sensor domain-containing protein/signal transduction histidine kinase